MARGLVAGFEYFFSDPLFLGFRCVKRSLRMKKGDCYLLNDGGLFNVSLRTLNCVILH